MMNGAWPDNDGVALEYWKAFVVQAHLPASTGDMVYFLGQLMFMSQC